MSEMHPDDSSAAGPVEPELPLEAPEADAFEQTLVVDQDDDDYR